MKLSEAGLLGNMLVEQANGKLMIDKSACFLGGALLAIVAIELGTLSTEEEDAAYKRLRKEWPFLDSTILDTITYGILHGDRRIVMSIIWELNDTLHWTRPRIAEWVATIEPQESLLLPDLTSTHLLEVGKQVGCK